MSFTYLPREGPGWYGYSTDHAGKPNDHKRWGTRDTIVAVVRASSMMLLKHGIEVGIGNISLQQGGYCPPHIEHRTGDQVDFRPIRLDRVRDACYCLPGGYGYQQYDRKMTAFLIAELMAAGFQSFLFCDPEMTGLVIGRPGHVNHIHAYYHEDYSLRQPQDDETDA